MSNKLKDIATENIDVNSYIEEYIKELKCKDIVVDSVDEALKLAQTYKSTSKYNWFRGQTGLWPLIPGTNRLNDKERNRAEEKLKRFDNWANANEIFKNFDQSEAIAQHYGLKTMFIDFTEDPKVAAYFASDNIDYLGYKYSCIYCLNTQDFNESIENIKKVFPELPAYPRLIDIKVDNLWRLESQKGKFLYQPSINFDWFYSLCRIVFKVKENDIKLFDKSYIYPDVKSVQEERLDGFFLNERTAKNLKRTNSFIEELKRTGLYIEKFEIDNELYIKEFVNEETLLNYKWKQKDLKTWKNKTVEKFQDIYTKEIIILPIEPLKKIDKNRIKIYEHIVNLLNTNIDIRKKAINFTIKDSKNNSEFVKKFEKYSNLIWNGMRKLPYENNEIAKVISNLILIIDISTFEYEKLDKNFLKIGINDGVGGFNNAFVNKFFLYEAMRNDLNKCIVDNIKDVRSIIYHIRSPQLLYKFESLKKLFVESIIISQVVYGENNFVIFSPYELKMLGLP